MKSMTGYGRDVLKVNGREYTVDIKSVNHKYKDISIKMPRELNFLEDKVRTLVSKHVSRGKIDVWVSFINNTTVGKNISMNIELANTYVSEIRKLAKEAQIGDSINVMDITRLPDVLNISVEKEEEDTIWQELEQGIETAVNNFNTMKEAEGNKIKEDLLARIEIIQGIIQKINQESSGLIEDYVVKLSERAAEILRTSMDENRIAQEAVIYADKTSIEEELTRLKSHVDQLLHIINKVSGPCGKKLDFLIQEMNREINTIGSKSGKLEITNLVIDAKTGLEDIREQIQNLE